MKSPSLFLKFILVVLTIGAVAAAAHAQATVYWCANSNSLGGSGTWNTSLTNWSTNASGGLGTTIVSPNSTSTNFSFAGAAGTVTENSSFSMAGLSILSSGYIFSNNATRTWTGDTNTGLSSSINITNNANATFAGLGWVFDALTMTGGTGASLTVSNTTIIFGTTGAKGGRTNFVNTIATGSTNVLGTQSVSGATQAGNITNNASLIVITNSANDNTYVVAGSISGNGAITLVNSGSSSSSPGKIALSASNSYAGGTTLNALAFSQTFSTNSTNSIVTTNTVNSGLNSIRIADSSAFGSGTVTAAGVGTNSVRATVSNLNLANALTLNSGSILFLGTTNTGHKLTLSGAVSGFGSLGADSGGTVILATNNTYSGTATIISGTLQVGNGGTAGTLGSGDVIDNDKLAFDRSDSFTVSNNISGSGSISKSANGANGILTLAGSNSYSGNTTISSGTIRVATINALSASSVLLGSSTTTNFSTLDLAAGGNYVLNSFGSSSSAGANLVFTNSSGSPASLTFTAATNYITISSGTSQGRTVANSSTDLSLIFNGAVDIGSSSTNDITFNSVGSTVINGTIFNTNTGVRNLIKSGVGALTLAGSNSFNGATTVSAGTLRLANSYVLGAANGLTNTVSSGAAVELHGGIVVNDEILSLNGRGVNDDGALRNISGNNAFNGTILLNSTNRINSDAGTLTIGAVITNTTGKALSSSRSLLVGGAGNIVMMGGLDGTGTGGLIKDGAGTLTLNAASTYNGPTAVSAGTLEVKQANGVPANASTLTVSSGARLKADTNLSVGAMTLAGTLQMALGSTISSGGSVDVSGATIALTGAPSASSYILVTGTAITATNALLLSPAISGYSLVISGNTLALQQDSSGGFTAWASGYNLSGTNAGQTADPDLDGFINNLEYAFGGNPTVGTPALLTSSSSGSTIACSFIASTNSAAVSYVVESTTDLVAGPWSSNSLTQSITNSADTNNILLYPAYVRRGFSAAATNASGKIFYRIKSIISQ